MIVRIEYKLNFSNGKEISQCLQLNKGSTLITGANGKGKSLNFEMVGFSLFGTKALRGVAGDYKRMKVELDICINGKKFTIKRTKSKSEVFFEGEPVASGTKPVNQWVVRTLGYGFDVFRIAHWCAQGDIQALADMRPTERKAMIDSVAGLTQMDSLAEEMSNDSRELKAIISTHKEGLVEPVEPTRPEVPRSDVEDSYANYSQQLESLIKAQAVMKPQEPNAPTEPATPEFPDEPVPLKPSMNAPKAPEIKEGMPGTVSQLVTVEGNLNSQIDKARVIEQNYLRLEVQTGEAELPKKWQDFSALQEAWAQYERYCRVQELKAQSTLTCPHCSGEFHLSKEVDELEKRPLSESKPSITISEWQRRDTIIQANAEFEKVKAEYEALNIDDLREALNQVRSMKSALMQFEQENRQYKQHVSQIQQANNSQRESYDKQCTRIQANYDNQVKLYNSQKANFEAQMQAYREALDVYETAQVQIKALCEKLGDNPEAKLRQALNMVTELRGQWSQYDSKVERYEDEMAQYKHSIAGVAEQEDQLEELTRARAALKDVKARVQSHLLPSLNKVASTLMSEMTGGTYQSVEVGQDFEVTVDGQPMRTLSGSGKDLANLTLRIGLGRILTHRVLPVMMLDEIDSAMDDERASFTWQCIQRITPHIGQVLQASHKELDAQSRVEV